MNAEIVNKLHLCFNQADYNAMRTFINRKLSNINPCQLSATALWSEFNDIMQEAIKMFVPHTSLSSKQKKPLWMTGKVLRTVKKKHKLWK